MGSNYDLCPSYNSCLNWVPEDIGEKFLNCKCPLSDQLLKIYHRNIYYIALQKKGEGKKNMNICKEARVPIWFKDNTPFGLKSGTPLLVWGRSGEQKSKDMLSLLKSGQNNYGNHVLNNYYISSPLYTLSLIFKTRQL